MELLSITGALTTGESSLVLLGSVAYQAQPRHIVN